MNLRWAVVTLGCAMALPALGSCASAPTHSADYTAPAAVSSAATAAVDRLGAIGDITSVTEQAAPATALATTGQKSGTWISLQSSATDYLSQEKARWIAGVIISEVWKSRHDAGDDSIVGGSLAPMVPSSDADGSGTNLTITPDLQKIMFTSQDGVTPSKLTVPDQSAYTSAVKAAADAVGLSVSSVTFTQSLGTVVQIDEVAADPLGFLNKYPRTNPGLTLDPNDVEGVLLAVRDNDGKIVKTSAWSTGSQSGEGGPGPDYGAAVGGETTAASSPSAQPS
jgi:hypothetical protein